MKSEAFDCSKAFSAISTAAAGLSIICASGFGFKLEFPKRSELPEIVTSKDARHMGMIKCTLGVIEEPLGVVECHLGVIGCPYDRSRRLQHYLCLGFGVWGLKFILWVSGCKVQGSGFRVQVLGSRVQGSGFAI